MEFPRCGGVFRTSTGRLKKKGIMQMYEKTYRRLSKYRRRCVILAILVFARGEADRFWVLYLLHTIFQIPKEHQDKFDHDIDNAVRSLREDGYLFSVEPLRRGTWKITEEGKTYRQGCCV